MPSFGLAHPRARFRFDRLTAAALARIAWSPSYRAPRAADLHDPTTFQPPAGPSDDEVMSGRDFITRGTTREAVRLVAVQPFVRELAACPHLATLRRLDLTGNRIGPEGVRELAESPHLGGLRELGLNGNAIGSAGAAALAVAPWLAGLERLEVADNGLGANDLGRFLRAVPRLAALDASDNPAGGSAFMVAREGMRHLIAVGVLRQRIRWYAWQPHPPGPPLPGGEGGDELHDGADPITASAVSQEGGLRGHPLALWGRGLGGGVDHANPSDSYTVFESPEPDRELETADLRHNGLGADLITKLFCRAPYPSLTHLDLGFNDCGNAGATALAAGAFPRLRTLSLKANRLTASGVALSLGTVESLDLSVNPLGDSGAVAALAPFPNVGHLDLSNTALTDAGLRQLVALGTLHGVRSLRLAWNRLTDPSPLLDLPRLDALDLTGCPVGRRAAVVLAARFGTIRG